MKTILPIAAALFFLLPMARATDSASPTMQDMEAWKRRTIAKYEKAVYLDETSRPIGEHEFFVRVVKEKRGNTITTVQGSNKVITLRLLSDAELGWTPLPKSK